MSAFRLFAAVGPGVAGLDVAGVVGLDVVAGVTGLDVVAGVASLGIAVTVAGVASLGLAVGVTAVASPAVGATGSGAVSNIVTSE